VKEERFDPMLILIPILGFLAILCIPTSVFLLTFAFDHPPLETCVKCNYDLRGSPTRMCAECGTLNPSPEECMPIRRRRLLFVLGLVAAAIPIGLLLFVIVAFMQIMHRTD